MRERGLFSIYLDRDFYSLGRGISNQGRCGKGYLAFHGARVAARRAITLTPPLLTASVRGIKSFRVAAIQ